MKLNTFIMLSKGAAYVLTGFFAPWTAALAQWMNSGDWPPTIAWIVLMAVSLSSAASAWLAFCSGSWKEYSDARETAALPNPPADATLTQPKEKAP